MSCGGYVNRSNPWCWVALLAHVTTFGLADCFKKRDQCGISYTVTHFPRITRKPKVNKGLNKQIVMATENEEDSLSNELEQ